jgi:DNA polymerase-3 subunit epsilon
VYSFAALVFIMLKGKNISSNDTFLIILSIIVLAIILRNRNQDEGEMDIAKKDNIETAERKSAHLLTKEKSSLKRNEGTFKKEKIKGELTFALKQKLKLTGNISIEEYKQFLQNNFGDKYDSDYLYKVVNDFYLLYSVKEDSHKVDPSKTDPDKIVMTKSKGLKEESAQTDYTYISPPKKRIKVKDKKRKKLLIDHIEDLNFVAFDFETANNNRNSACALALIEVEEGKIVNKKSFMIRPPSLEFQFTYIHGIRLEDVRTMPTFERYWSQLSKVFAKYPIAVGHNVAFDKSVLQASCETYGLDFPSNQFLCTVKLAREIWDIYPTKLPNVCSSLGIDLNHHDPLSDALASTKIVLKAFEEEGKILVS